MTIIQKHPFVGLVTLCLLVVLATACSDDNTSAGSGTDTASDSSSSGPNGDGDADGDGDVDTDPGGWHSAECVVTTCEGKLYQCGDCIDNDSDGRIDSQDSNCLGPCDNNESGFNLQIPGNDNVGCMRDCYFDKDEGSGNDDCHWDHRCDSLQPVAIASCSFSQPCPACDCDGWMESQTGQCLDYCTPLVPNGCDCFGCCQFSDADDSFRFLGSPGCDVDNKEKCSPCTPVVSCFNPCGRC
jgi:hypothetical protein